MSRNIFLKYNLRIGTNRSGDVTTNAVEGYFSIFKRGMRSVYQHCAEKHLHRYLSEYDFRFNCRVKLGFNDGERANLAIKVAASKRLTSSKLSLSFPRQLGASCAGLKAAKTKPKFVGHWRNPIDGESAYKNGTDYGLWNPTRFQYRLESKKPPVCSWRLSIPHHQLGAASGA